MFELIPRPSAPSKQLREEELLRHIMLQVPRAYRQLRSLESLMPGTPEDITWFNIDADAIEIWTEALWVFAHSSIRRVIEEAYGYKTCFRAPRSIGLCSFAVAASDWFAELVTPADPEVAICLMQQYYEYAWPFIDAVGRMRSRSPSGLVTDPFTLENDGHALILWQIMEMLATDAMVSALRMHYGRTFFLQGTTLLGAYGVGMEDEPDVKHCLALSSFFLANECKPRSQLA